MSKGFLISIPVPPSVNQMFANNPKRGRGRFKTKVYKDWLKHAGAELMLQKPEPVRGKYRFYLTLPKIRGDGSNRIKAAEDFLVAHKLVDDDRFCVDGHWTIDEELAGYATIAVEAVCTVDKQDSGGLYGYSIADVWCGLCCCVHARNVYCGGVRSGKEGCRGV